jgi:hypothetical protein
MKNHIFENIEIIDGLGNYPKLVLKLSSEFKEMGFEAVNYHAPINEDTYEGKMALYVKPVLTSANYTSLSIRSEEYDSLIEFLSTLKGYSPISGINKPTDEDKIPIKAAINKKFSEIGCYLKNRNIVVLYFPIFYNIHFDLGLDNEYIFYFVNNLKEWIKSNKLEKVDVRKKLKELMLENFIKGAKSRIISNTGIITGKEIDIRSHGRRIIDNYKEIEIYKAEIVALKGILLNAKTVILKQIGLIEELPFVKSVRLTRRGISINVGDISIKYQGHIIKIGKFHIHLKPSSIELENKTPLKIENEGRIIHHPHINNPTSFCLGNRAPKIYELLAKFELKKLVYFLYLFLKNYNLNDKMNDIKYWADEQKIELEAETASHNNPPAPAQTEIDDEEDLDDGGRDEDG